MATYINAKLRKAIEAGDTRTINRECYGLFKADHPDYTIGVSDPAIFKEWVREFIASVAEPTEPTTKHTKTADSRKTKQTQTTKKSGSRDKKSSEPKAKTNSKSKSNSKSRKEKADAETTTEIDRNKLIAKLKADYICDRISADKFAKTLEILTNI